MSVSSHTEGSGRSKDLRNSPLARLRTCNLSWLKFLPARLISKLSMDIAERNGLDLRRGLASADFLSEAAMARALLSLNTPDLRSIALLRCVTPFDHFAFFFMAPLCTFVIPSGSASLPGMSSASVPANGRRLPTQNVGSADV